MPFVQLSLPNIEFTNFRGDTQCSLHSFHWPVATAVVCRWLVSQSANYHSSLNARYIPIDCRPILSADAKTTGENYILLRRNSQIDGRAKFHAARLRAWLFGETRHGSEKTVIRNKLHIITIIIIVIVATGFWCCRSLLAGFGLMTRPCT